MPKYALGGIKSPPDYRDVQLSSIAGAALPPDSFSLDTSSFPIFNQHSLGACVGHAGAKDSQEKEYNENKIVVSASARFLYALCKCFDGVAEQGTYPRTMMKMRQKYGCATEATVPNDTTLDHETYCYKRSVDNFPATSFAEAEKYTIKSYVAATLSVAGIKQAIYQGNGAVALIAITEDWFGYSSGPMPLQLATDGNHEVFFKGYEPYNGKTLVKGVNSWGKEWGMQGEFELVLEDWLSRIQEVLTSVDLPDTLLEHLHTLPAPGTFHYNFTEDLRPDHIPGVTWVNNIVEVRALQIALSLEGIFKDITEPQFMGFYGSNTEECVREFQNKYHLPVTGNVDQPTRNQLNMLYNV